jgi:phosphopantothenoylcysteine decarboxylase/phosphopantothenate--cysteine ligase
MWSNPVVKENIEKLKRMGYQIIRPVSGMLACGYEGEGKLEDILKIKDEIMKQLSRADSLKGKKIIVTSGGTKEKIDEVRVITNKSSGKMGAAIAEELYLRGAEVLFLRAIDAVKPRYLIKEETFETAQELHDLMKQATPNYDTIFHVAAVSDFQVSIPHQGKISSSEAFTLTMKPQTKIINYIKTWNPKIQLFAFKATSGKTEAEMIDIAKQKLIDTKADAIIANDAAASGEIMNEVLVVLSNGVSKNFRRDSKNVIAQEIITYLPW